MAPTPSGVGSPGRDLDPLHSPIEALARALWNLRVREPARTQLVVARAIPCDTATVSKLTNGRDLPSEPSLDRYLIVCEAPNPEAWKALRGLAGAAAKTLNDVEGSQRSALSSFAEKLLACCAAAGVSLAAAGSRQDARAYTAQLLVEGWVAAAAAPEPVPVPDRPADLEPEPGLWTALSEAPETGPVPVPAPAQTAGLKRAGEPEPETPTGSGQGAGPDRGRPASSHGSHRRYAGFSIGALAVTGVVVVGLTVVPAWLRGDDDSSGKDGKPGSSLPRCTKASVTLNIAASTDKSAPLQDLARQYGPRLAGGQCVDVAVSSIDSGSAMKALARGWSEDDGPEPDVWSPASRAWLAVARQRATAAAKKRLPEMAGQSVVTSPLTIAMPRPMAEALGWPEKKIDWKELAAYAAQPDFWKSKGHPEWGDFKLGKTNPQYSTSGLNATIGVFFTEIGTTGEMNPEDLDDPKARTVVRSIENAAVHYGDTTLTFLSNLRRADDDGDATSYISAVTVEENSVVAYNKGYPCGSQSNDPQCAVAPAKLTPPKTLLVAFYPTDTTSTATDGSASQTLYSDHPYIELNGIAQAKKKVADDFQKFLTSDTAISRFTRLGFRTAQGKVTTQLTPANGVLGDKKLTAQSTPAPDVLDKMLAAWRELRKPANVLTVIDTSGSMDWGIRSGTNEKAQGEPSRLDLVKQAQGPLFDGFTDRDKVGLWTFAKEVKHVSPLQAMGSGTNSHRKDLKAGIDDLQATGATSLNQAVADAVDSLRAQWDPHAINAVVVLTDGNNDPQYAPPAFNQLRKKLTDTSKPVRVFTIAYGKDADTRTDPDSCTDSKKTCETYLQEIAELSHARTYNARDPKTISNILTNVISNF
ncbi:substrate-binding and VWA domain-containing protein [Streptomyces sp. NPDC050549]|uniref:vWA domain-containing protein n=1 Tax=Streptomyces sp. NPDC050549 TaxID=3155406 RepID=UPI0034456FF6